jgi:hypothetical protein
MYRTRRSITTYSPRKKTTQRMPSAMKSTAVVTPRIHAHLRWKSSPQPIAISKTTGTMALKNE